MAPPTERARGLGYFSLALGTAQLLMPGQFARLIGTHHDGRTMRLLGMRELTAGVGLLVQQRPSIWLWSRVAGDLMDLGLLTLTMTDKHNHRGRTMAGVAAVAGVTAMDVMTAREMSTNSSDEDQSGAVRVVKAITVRKPVQEVYAFWRNFRNFPMFMRHVDNVAVFDERRSHWTARGPAGRSVEWDAEITQDEPNTLIAWRSLPGADVTNWGSVRFSAAPGGRGTEVRVDMEYHPPAGGLGAMVARLFGEEPRQQVQADLRKFKQVLEAGEVIRSEATIGSANILQGPAAPEPASETMGAHS